MLHVTYEWDWKRAEFECRRALELNPNLASAHQTYSIYLVSRGDIEGGLVEQKRAVELEPLSPSHGHVLGSLLLFARQYPQAIEQYKKTIELDPNIVRPHELLAFAYCCQANYGAALAEVELISHLPGGLPNSRVVRGYAQALASKQQEARRILQELNPRMEEDLLQIFRTSFLCAALEDRDLAFELLSRCCDERLGVMVFFEAYPMFDPLRSDPRFEALRRRRELREA